MRHFKEKSFGERLEAAAKAKEAALQKFAERPADDDPAVIARRAQRLEVAKAREARIAEREAKKLADKAKREADAELEIAREAERKVELEKQQKAARDARYAARKAQK